MARDTVVKATIDIGAKLDDFQRGIKQVDAELKKLSLAPDIKNDFNSMFEKFDVQLKKLKEKTEKNEVKLIDEKSVQESFNQLGSLYDQLIKKLNSKGVKTSFLEKDVVLIKELSKYAQKYNEKLSQTDSKLAKAVKDYDDQIKKAKQLGDIQQQASKKAEKRNLKVQTAETELSNAKKITDQLENELKQRQADLKLAQAQVKAEEDRKKALEDSLAIQKQEAQKAWLSDDKKHKNLRGFNTSFKASHLAQYKEIDEVEKARKEAEEYAKVLDGQVIEAENKFKEAVVENRENIEAKDKALKSAQKEQSNANLELEIATKNYNTASNEIKNFANEVSKVKAEEFASIREELDKFDWSKFGIEKPVIQSQEDLLNYINQLSTKSQEATAALLNGLTPALENIKVSGQDAKEGVEGAVTSAKKVAAVQTDLERLTQRLVQFFSIDNAVRLFKRAVRSATETVKELDKVMTETAVVTTFSVGDMWKQLPEYTKRANELGLAVKDVYQASTLYYQQGLKTNEVMQVTNATLRMARIASLDATEATDRMTNALRGFNMEINETNADRVADVYSKLAAISASNVDEISTAMTKVASLANSANMQFENTAAFLSQIIETTRESAETAGTALKTVVARFSEVKDLYSKGELLGNDEEGEEIDVNKVSKALRSAGINLNEFLTGQRGLDDIFMELASKWDSLDIVQQRYIATMAAGSRQQSRFIALMSDYKRTQELTTAAQNASGASMEQYEKTLESVETKLNRLKNAWNEFLMGIANDQFIRMALDNIINILKGINKLTDGISGGNGLLKSLANIGITVGGLKLGGSLIRKILGDPKQQVKGWLTETILGIKKQKGVAIDAGEEIGTGFEKGFMATLKKSGGLSGYLKKTFGKTLSASELGLKTVSLENIDFELNKNVSFNTLRSQALKNVDWTKFTSEAKTSIFNLNTEFAKGNITQEEYLKSLKESGVQMEVTGEQADELGLQFKNSGAHARTLSATFLGVGAAAAGLVTIIEKLTGKSTPLTKGIKATGAALMALGSILPIVSKAGWTFAGEMTAAIDSIPIIGWIAAVISLLIGLGVALADAIETPKEAAENSKQALESATEAANQAKEAVSNLRSEYEALVDSSNKLKDLTIGTQAWTEAVHAHNQEVLGLLDTYKELTVSNVDGELVIDNYDEVLKDYENQANNLLIGQMGNEINSINKEMESYFQNLRSVLPLQSLSRGTGDRQTQVYLNDDQIKQIAIASAENNFTTRQDFEDYIAKTFGLDSVGLGNIQIDEIKAIGQSFVNGADRVNNFGVALGGLVNSLAELDSASAEYAANFINNGERFTAIFNDLRDSLNSRWLWNDKQENDIDIDEYKQWVQSTYGKNVKVNTLTGNFKVGDQSFNYRDQGVKSAYSAWKVAKDAAEELRKYTEAEQKIAKQNESIGKSLRNKGQGLKLQDIDNIYDTLFGTSIIDAIKNNDNMQITDLYDEDSQLATAIKQYWDSLGEDVQAGLGDYNNWALEFATNLLNARDTFKTAINNFNDGSFKEAINNFSAETINSLLKQLNEYHPTDSNDFGVTILSELSNLIGDDLVEDTEKFEQIVEAFSKIALNSEEDLNSFKDTLTAMGFNVAQENYDNFIKNITDGIAVLTNVDVSKIKESLSDLSNVVGDIKSGKQDRNFSKDVYDKLAEAGVDMTSFAIKNDGSYLYIGDKLDNIVDAINEQTGELLGKGKTQLEAKEAAWNIVQGISTERDVYGLRGGFGTRKVTNKEFLQDVISGYEETGLNIGNLGINGLFTNLSAEAINQLSEETIDSWVSQIKEIAANNTYWKEQIKDFESTAEVTQLMSNTLESLVYEFANVSEDEQQKYRAAILSKISSNDVVPSEVLEQYITKPMTEQSAYELSDLNYTYSQAQAAELDLNQVKEYADLLVQTKQLGIDEATSLAVKNIKLNQSVSELISSYDDWNDLIGENGPLGKGMDKLVIRDSEQAKAYDTLKKKMGAALDVEKDLSDEFFASAENIKNLETLMNGTEDAKVEALHNLQKAAAIDFINPAMEQYDELVNLINGLEIPNMEVGATLEDGPFLESLKEMCALAGDASDTLMDYLGFETEDYIKDYKTITYYTQRGNEPPEPYDVKIPIWGTRVKRKGGGAANWSTLNSSNRNNTGSKDSGSKSGSGSGSSSKENLWKNPYDELYNLQQHINEALREREQLEHKYQDMLKDHTKTSEDLVENTLREVAALKRRLVLEKQMLAGRKRQVANVLGEMFEDSEGNRTTLGAMGVGKYANYDVDAGVIQIDYEAIDQIVDENLGSAIEQYISRLEELQGQINDTEDAIEEISDDLVEIKNRGKEEYLNFEQKVYDAIVHAREKEIETLEAINDAISDAASKTISAIQDEISKERQARENDKAEEDILDKEMRLAYLQRDTSGANDLEIMKLQEEITNDQQSYQDKIIDQTIQEMQDEATRAEQQRQAQIDILNEQLEWDQNYGKLWEDVQNYLKGAFDDDGRIKVDSGLYQLLSSDDGLIGKSEFGALQWKEDLAEQVAIAMQGLQNYTLTAARNEGRLKLADGTELSYNPKSGGWYNDKTKKEYTDSDLEWDYDAQAYKIRQKPIANMPTNDTSVGLSQPSKTTDATPTEPIDEGVIGKITNTYGWVNVRSSVDTSSYSNVIGHTNTGEQLDVIGYGDYGWYKVKLPNGQIGYTARHQNGTQLYSFNAYARGGLADFTGPAWLDGSKSRPEMVLDAADTQNFIALKDILASILRNTQSGNTKASSGDNYFDIDIQAEIDSDYDVDRLAERIKKQIYDAAAYRNVNVISQMR